MELLPLLHSLFTPFLLNLQTQWKRGCPVVLEFLVGPLSEDYSPFRVRGKIE